MLFILLFFTEKPLDDDSDDNSGDAGADLRWELPENAQDLDVDVMASLPAHLRKDLIEEARKKDRMKRRSHYLPVAGVAAVAD